MNDSRRLWVIAAAVLAATLFVSTVPGLPVGTPGPSTDPRRSTGTSANTKPRSTTTPVRTTSKATKAARKASTRSKTTKRKSARTSQAARKSARTRATIPPKRRSAPATRKSKRSARRTTLPPEWVVTEVVDCAFKEETFPITINSTVTLELVLWAVAAPGCTPEPLTILLNESGCKECLYELRVPAVSLISITPTGEPNRRLLLVSETFDDIDPATEYLVSEADSEITVYQDSQSYEAYLAATAPPGAPQQATGTTVPSEPVWRSQSARRQLSCIQPNCLLEYRTTSGGPIEFKDIFGIEPYPTIRVYSVLPGGCGRVGPSGASSPFSMDCIAAGTLYGLTGSPPFSIFADCGQGPTTFELWLTPDLQPPRTQVTLCHATGVF